VQLTISISALQEKYLGCVKQIFSGRHKTATINPPQDAWITMDAEVAEEQIRAEVRDLGPADLAGALELSRLAGWNQTEADWRRLLALSPDACCCIEVDGRVVATTTLVRYDRHCGWIGMVLTHPDWRGRGFARRLVGHSLAIAQKLGIATIKLDATTQGQRLYESFGFRAEQGVERWERQGISDFSESLQSYSLAMDQSAYGYSRADLLESLGVGAKRNDRANAYVLTRPGATRSYIGPCIAQDPDTARQLLTPVVDAVPGSGWFWDIFTDNRNAAALASTMGFKPVRSLVRMSVGPRIREQEQNVYALAGFEFG
jgi:GNAT superfamily N-acetyltransferase